MNDLRSFTEPPLPCGTAVLHGVVIRPPQIEWTAQPVQSARLLHADVDAVRRLPHVLEVVVRRDFIGLVATTAQSAEQAATQLRATWWAPSGAVEDAASLARTRVVAKDGADEVADSAGVAIEASYSWPLNVSANESVWAVAECGDSVLTIWAPIDAPGNLRAELAALLELPPAQVRLVCVATGMPCPEARHAAADAALLSRAVGRVVRVDLTPAQLRIGHGYPVISQVKAALGPDACLSVYQMVSGATPPSAPPLALVLTGVGVPTAEVPQTPVGAVPPYRYANLHISETEARGVAPVANPAEGMLAAHVFAHECALDELAAAAGIDPVHLRIAHIKDENGSALVQRVAARAGWEPGHRRAPGTGVAHGRGFAYASVPELDDQTPGSHAAWVAEVTVDMSTGEVSVARVVVGHDESAHRLSAARVGVLSDMPGQALEHAALEEARRLTAAAASFDSWDLAAIAASPGHTAPPPAKLQEKHANQPLLRGAGTAMLPAAPAIANAIFDATGVRLREPPFSPERIRQALDDRKGLSKPQRRGMLAAAGAAALAALAAMLPWRAPIAPTSPPSAGFYSAQTIERGRLVAAAGDCAVCHTAPNGKVNAGGLALDTPFGIIYSSNITPDPDTGIGSWSYAAFERAMREGVHRDGRRLYPAFPYTAFAKISEADMQSLYAYLMSQPAVASRPPETKLAFPFNMRPMLTGWNLLFHRNTEFRPDPSRSAAWNRGAYLAEGLGHCSACHSPRNALGAEKAGKAYLGGGQAEGWDAPALGALSHAPLPWTEDELYSYMRHGYAPLHGPAAGPMAPVVESLAELPDSDVRAIATYIASFNTDVPSQAVLDDSARKLRERSEAEVELQKGAGANIFAGACAVCHTAEQGLDMFGEKLPLALNTNLHAPRPDNLIQVLMRGVSTSASSQVGAMPGFADSLSDRQMTELVEYLRRVYAPDKPAWTDVGTSVARLRTAAH